MLQIHIHYSTQQGQQLCLIPCQDFDGPTDNDRYVMHAEDGDNWWCALPTAVMDDREDFAFYFIVADDTGQLVREEWHCVPHILHASCLTGNAKAPTVVYCQWMDAPEDAFLYTPLQQLEKQYESENLSIATNEEVSPHDDGVCIIVRAPHLDADERLCLSGAHNALGAWNTDNAVAMKHIGECRWMAWIPYDACCGEASEAKLIARTNKSVRWELGNNRTLRMPGDGISAHDGVSIINKSTTRNAPPFTITIELPDARLPFCHPRLAGTMVPVFSLRSEGSFGVGDFGDLMTMTDFMHATQQRLLQLLPINDTTTDGRWTDSYPYRAVSVFALHPMYIDLRQLPPLRLTRQQRKYFAEKQQALNNLTCVDYEQVNAVKHEYLRIAFKQHWLTTCCTRAFRQWFKEVSQWLVPYAAYCHLRDTYGTADFDRWHGHCTWNERQRTRWQRIRRNTVEPHYYYFYLQWLLHTQLSIVHAHARSKGVLLKGDIGIGVSAQACDVWQHPHYFHRDMQAGAPPDYFSRSGQNWGFPTYDWNTMADDGYLWWKQRLQHMARYFDAFRIDHILGFFRIWEIPLPMTDGREGHFFPALPLTTQQALPYDGLCMKLPHHDNAWHPRINAHDTEAYRALDNERRETFNRLFDDFFFHRHNAYWYREAMKKLSVLLNATRMLPCGEDLGMVPEGVATLMHQLKILSLELETMPKGQHHGEFADATHFPYLSVCMPSTHDVAPLRLWWEEDTARRQRYYNTMLQYDGNAPDMLSPDLAQQIVNHYLHSPAMLCVIPIQDWLATTADVKHAAATDERVNDPANSQHYWRYRMNVNIIELMRDEHFISHICKHIVDSGRGNTRHTTTDY